MRRVALFGVVGFALAAAGGCESNSPDAVMRAMLADIGTLTTSLKKNEPVEKQREIISKMKATLKRFDDLSLSKEEKEKLKKKYFPEFTLVTNRLFGAIKNPVSPELGAVIQEAQDIIGKFSRG